MTQSAYPFSNSPILDANQWSKMAQNWLDTGVLKGKLNEFQVYADSTGMQVKTKSGQAYLKGHFFESDTEEVLAIGTANTNPRIDRIIIRLDWVANSIQLAVLQGIEAVSPAAPALTQNTSRWEISLAQVYVNKSVSTIAAGNVTDERNFVKNLNSENFIGYTDLSLTSGWLNFGGVEPTAQYTKIGKVVYIKGTIKSGTSGADICLPLPSGYRPSQRLMIPVLSNNGTTAFVPTKILIYSDGRITIGGEAANGFVYLSGVSYVADGN